jgi:hypothetical protein
MPHISISEKEILDTRRLAAIIMNVESEQNDIVFANTVADELYLHQPFVLSMMMGYKMDLLPRELDAVINLYIIAWEFFKNEANVRTLQITRQHYERVEHEKVRMLQKADAAHSHNKRMNLFTDHLNQSSSKALLALVYKEFNENEVIGKMDIQTRGILLIGLTSVIQCYENIMNGITK